MFELPSDLHIHAPTHIHEHTKRKDSESLKEIQTTGPLKLADKRNSNNIKCCKRYKITQLRANKRPKLPNHLTTLQGLDT